MSKIIYCNCGVQVMELSEGTKIYKEFSKAICKKCNASRELKDLPEGFEQIFGNFRNN